MADRLTTFRIGGAYLNNDYTGEASDDGHVYVGGFTASIDPSGHRARILGYNYRNSFEGVRTSLGDMFLNDNDDPPACRVSHLIEGGSFGFFSADGKRQWRADKRPGQSIPVAEWRQEDPGTMPAGEGTASGFTRNLGTDLRNDHPISVTFTSQLAARDGELRPVDAQQRWPAGTGTVVGVRAPGYRPLVPLEPTGSSGAGQVQCASCHDPHLRELDAAKGNAKFLRGQRFQEAAPSASYSAVDDILCLACHDKNLGSGVWAQSAHARPDVANETYKPEAARLREFPDGLPVWKAACLNCHDTHTVPGARRLTREGTDGGQPGANPLAARQGGNPALENTCYACHTSAARSALASTLQVPDIETPFGMAVRMPITTAEQGGAGEEVHDPSSNFADPGIDCSTATNRCGADGLEPKATLARRHAECTDCHNPHRVTRNRLFNADATVPDAAGTHRHDETTGYTHTNLASGVLRGSWGVEPQYGSTGDVDPSTSDDGGADDGGDFGHLIVEAGLKPYDVTALIPIVERAGGVMGPTLYNPASAKSWPAGAMGSDQAGFEAVLYPNLSLGRSGFIAVMAGVSSASVLMSGAFILAGAWPVAGFFGLDVLLLYLAFRIATAPPLQDQAANAAAPGFGQGLFLGLGNPKAYEARIAAEKRVKEASR